MKKLFKDALEIEKYEAPTRNFYNQTVHAFDAVYIDVMNYVEIGGETSAIRNNQTEITVNDNYPLFNPVFDVRANQILPEAMKKDKVKILIPSPDGEENYINKNKNSWVDINQENYKFIRYADNSVIYSYQPDAFTDGTGRIEGTTIIVHNDFYEDHNLEIF